MYLAKPRSTQSRIARPAKRTLQNPMKQKESLLAEDNPGTRENDGQLHSLQREHSLDTSEPDGQPRRRLDTSRAKNSFGFEATVHFREGIERTIRWFGQVRQLQKSTTTDMGG